MAEKTIGVTSDLIKQFADDSGHTTAEFYTNRTVVRLMPLIMDPRPGESVYDPTCSSGGLLLNCALQLKDAGQEYRTLKLYGQEINLITSAIARMNMFLHGIKDFYIVRGNALSHPNFLENDELEQFGVILANPPYAEPLRYARKRSGRPGTRFYIDISKLAELFERIERIHGKPL